MRPVDEESRPVEKEEGRPVEEEDRVSAIDVVYVMLS